MRGCVNPLRNHRVQSVCTDDDVGVDVETCAGRNSRHPAHATAIIDNHFIDANAVADLSAAGACGIDERPVEQIPPRCVQRLDVEFRFDRHDDVLIPIAERGGTHGRGAGGHNRGQDAPSMQLQDGASHERMRR